VLLGVNGKVARNSEGTAMVWIFILFSLVVVLRVIAGVLEDREAAKKERALETFKRENPELWRQQESLKLEKERLEAQTKLAQEEARVGFIFGVGRVWGLW
jgi:hypothetical protein